MKKYIAIAAFVVSAVTITGFSTAEFFEIFQVARNRVHAQIEQSIPTSVHVDRLELILEKLEPQLQKQRHRLAKAQVAMERTEKQWEQSRELRDEYVTNMRKLRTIEKEAGNCNYVQIGCKKLNMNDVRSSLTNQFNRYKACQSICEEKQRLVNAQRDAVRSLQNQLSSWQQEKVLLEQKLDVLRTRSEVENANREIDGTTAIDGSELQRASELADKIEQRLAVAKKERALSTNGFDPVLTVTRDSNIESEIDALLANQ